MKLVSRLLGCVCLGLLVGCSKPVAYESPSINSLYYDHTLSEEENIAALLKQEGVEAEPIIIKATEEPNIAILMELQSPITSLSIQDIDIDHYMASDFDMTTYLQTKTDEPVAGTPVTSGNVGDVVVILCVEPDTMPHYYISWEAKTGETDTYVVEFNGKGPDSGIGSQEGIGE